MHVKVPVPVNITVIFTEKEANKHGTKYQKQLECGPMPNVMTALPNTGGALCSTPQSLADTHYWSAVQ